MEISTDCNPAKFVFKISDKKTEDFFELNGKIGYIQFFPQPNETDSFTLKINDKIFTNKELFSESILYSSDKISPSSIRKLQHKNWIPFNKGDIFEFNQNQLKVTELHLYIMELI